MTFAKYKRLFLVLFLPLLLAGIIVEEILDNNFTRTSSTFCDSSSCRNGGRAYDSFFNMIDDRGRYFTVYDNRDKKIFPPVDMVIRVSDMSILDATVTGISNISGASLYSEKALNGLVGTVISMISFSEKNKVKSSFMQDGGILLSCSTLSIEDEAGSFESMCSFDNISFLLKYSLKGKSAAYLSNLINNIDSGIDKKRNEKILSMLLGYPMFIYIFLIISGVIWLVRKAARYVSSAE